MIQVAACRIADRAFVRYEQTDVSREWIYRCRWTVALLWSSGWGRKHLHASVHFSCGTERTAKIVVTYS